MTVTSVKKTGRKGLIDVAIDGKSSFLAYREILVRYDIYEGAEIDNRTLRAAKAAHKELYAKQSGLDILSSHDYSKSQFIRKMKLKGFSGETAEKTSDYLEERGLISDESYARQLCEYLFNVKKYGAMRVKSELFEKGIRGELADICIEELEGDSASRLLSIVGKKFTKEELADREKAHKAAAKLCRYGYSFSEIREAFRVFCNADIDEE